MKSQPSPQFYQQCLRRAEARSASPGFNRAQVQEMAGQAADIIASNLHRIPANYVSDPITGIPDQYIDEVLSFIVSEGQHIKALKENDASSWGKMLRFIYSCVLSVLHNPQNNYSRSFAIGYAVDDLANHCAFLVWLKLDRYSFDVSLERWVARFVLYEIKGVHRSADYKINMYARSFQDKVGYGDKDIFLEDTVLDSKYAHKLEMREYCMDVERAADDLSADQKEVVTRQLEGQTTKYIAQEMARTTNSVYSLRHRAITNLRAALDGK